MANVVAGELDEAERDLEVLTGIAEQLRKPAASLAGSGAPRGAGRIADGAVLPRRRRCYRRNARWASVHSLSWRFRIYRLQRYTLAELRGEFESVEDEVLERSLAAVPGRPVFSCVLHPSARGPRALREARAGSARLAVDDLTQCPSTRSGCYA